MNKKSLKGSCITAQGEALCGKIKQSTLQAESLKQKHKDCNHVFSVILIYIPQFSLISKSYNKNMNHEKDNEVSIGINGNWYGATYERTKSSGVS